MNDKVLDINRLREHECILSYYLKNAIITKVKSRSLIQHRINCE